jgi:hypothetical protein
MNRSNIERNMRADRINRIGRLSGARSYLEIGVFDGATFFDVDIKHKVAVDPNFLFDFASKENRTTKFYPVTSDVYFQSCARGQFDIIYLDGLHTFEQTLRDFMNSLHYAHQKTVWLIDDTVPNDNFSALADQERCYRLRRMQGNPDWAWMGDVFKVVYFMRNAMRFYSVRTFTGHGQTVAWRDMTAFNETIALPLDRVGQMTYEDFCETYREAMNVTDDDKIYADLQAFLST